jgi:DeoR/GlpR family transcriptional regulator of sugar metabolism
MEKAMLTTQRKQYILGRLKKDGQIVAKAISQELDLSEDTIRRDLRELAKEGLLQRVHGGALPASLAVVDFAAREKIASEAKKAIGKTAANLIQTGQVVIVDGGTTTVQLVRHLPKDLSATIITHSPSIAVELVNYPNIEVIMIGGRLFKHSVVTVGAAALEAIKMIRADMYFMGVTGIHLEAGLSTGDLEEAHIKRALSQSAAETIVLASAEKINAASPYVIAPFGILSGMVVEVGIPEEILAPYRQSGVSLIEAE